MIQLAYCSIARPPFTDNDVANILAVSRMKNRDHAITGVLLYQSGFVVQVLEGDPTSVRQLYSNIQRDPRHTAVRLVYERELVAREFPDWTMGFHYAEFGYTRPPESFSTMLTKLTDDFPVPSHRGTLLLRHFARVTR